MKKQVAFHTLEFAGDFQAICGRFYADLALAIGTAERHTARNARPSVSVL